ncbi:MAG TPA: HD domain-containing protein [Gemmatimonadales bacterium]|nr:HD domain-containing protein [Gemmatimonadales bacterium]
MSLSRAEVVRDPLWDNIRIEQDALALIDTPALQRLRYVRQLGHAFLVYPGATHTRFEHALGTYHLARRALAQLDDTEGHGAIPPDSARAVRYAALLHDIGHYPFSHALEEAGLPNHEQLVARQFENGELRAVLARHAIPTDPLLCLIQGRSDAPLAGLISGSLDVDKLDYLSRDAWMCGVPYGTIDVDRLLACLTLASTPDGPPSLALEEKGLSALESLLFAKYQMYRNVYWHHAVRSATAMFKRLVMTAIGADLVRVEDIAASTDDGLIHELQREDPTKVKLALRLRERRLAKRTLDVPGSEVPENAGSWISSDPALCREVEDQLARELELGENEVFLDFPAKPDMLALDLSLVRRDGVVLHLAGEEAREHLELPRVATELYRSARRLRLFVLRPLASELPVKRVMDLVAMPGEHIRARLDSGRALLG